MPKLAPLNIRGVIKKLRKMWYEWPFFWWKHAHMKINNKVIPIPMHWGKDLWVWLIRKIINQVNITPQERIDL